jgi:hypothetical protein
VSVVLHIGGLIGSKHPEMLARVEKELGKNIQDLTETEK